MLPIFFAFAICPLLGEGMEVSAYPQQCLNPRRVLVGASTETMCQSPAQKVTARKQQELDSVHETGRDWEERTPSIGLIGMVPV